MILRLVRRAKRDVMHTAGALPGGGCIPALEHMQFGGGSALAHRKYMDLRAVRSIVADAAHVHDPGQHQRGARKILHGEHDRAETPDLVLWGHRAILPWRGRARAAVVNQHQTLPFIVLERQRQPAVDFHDLAGDAAGRPQAVAPVAKTVFAGDAQAGARDRIAAAPLGGGRKIEEGQVGAGIGFAVGVEQVVGADVVLVDGLLDQPHAQNTPITRQILARFGRNRGEVMDSA